MKTKLITLLICLAINTNSFAHPTSAFNPNTQSKAKSILTTKRVLIGSSFLALVGTGLYFFLNRDQRNFVHKNLANTFGGTGAIANHDLANNNPVDQIPNIIDPDAGFDKNQIFAAMEASLLLQKQIETEEVEFVKTELEKFEIQTEEKIEVQTEEKSIIQDEEPKTEKSKKKKVRSNMYLRTNYMAGMNELNGAEGFQTVEIGASFTFNGQIYNMVNTDSNLADLNINHAILIPDEILVMNHETEEALNEIFTRMMEAFHLQFPNGLENQTEFFQFVIQFIRTQVFDVEHSRSRYVAELIQKIIASENIIVLKSEKATKPVINLLYYLKARIGVCRHYSLVLGYLVQRFMNTFPNSCLNGGSIHIGAAEKHVWCVYVNPQTRNGVHLDALWDRWVPVGLDVQRDNLQRSSVERMYDSDKRIFFDESIIAIEEENTLEDSGFSWMKQAGIFAFSQIDEQTDEKKEKDTQSTPDWMSQGGIYNFEFNDKTL